MISLINAGPGTGKTFSLVYGYLTLKDEILRPIEPTFEQQEIFDYIQSEYHKSYSVCFFAFNNSVKDILTKRLGKSVKIFTFHGAGQSNIIAKWGYQKFIPNRTEKHIETLIGSRLKDMDWELRRKWIAVKRLLHYLKLEAMEPTEDTLEYLKLKYADLSSYTIPDDWEEHCSDLLELAGRPDGFIDYADMIWLGKRALTKPRFDLGFVDESQDISRSTYQLVTRMCKHVLLCGDPNQAVNAWNGASEEMYDFIAKRSDAVLPLKMTQRCPPHICETANLIRPGGIIEGPNQEVGEQRKVYYDSLPEMLKGDVNPANSLFISRTNAAILGLAIYFHERNIPAQIVDKDLAKELTNFVKNFRSDTNRSLLQKLAAYVKRAEGSKNALWAQMCQDKADCVRKILKLCGSPKDFGSVVKEIIEKDPAGFKLTTIHKAKGMEALNVFVVNPPVELGMAMSHPIAREQEINLHFVAVTRSARNLYWVVK